jgi:uncharacterized PurR-regulated membrane protein YhhQ (DUF165 family)
MAGHPATQAKSMLFLIAYISSVVLINFAFSSAPHLDVIWSAWGGLVFILRDMVQTRFGHGALIAMLAALILSYVTSDPTIALASATAFAVSECIDWLVFTVTKRPLRDRLWLSSALSIPVDTFIFFGLIDAMTVPVIATAMASKFAGVTAVWLIMAWRARKNACPG